MVLSEIVLGLLLALRGPDPTVHAKMIDPEPLALEIADAAEETPLFDTEQGVEKMALILVSYAKHESDYLERVRTCEVVGDGGRAIGLWQVHAMWWGGHSKQEVCSSSGLQARLAAKAIRYQVNRGVRSVPAISRAFASGDAGKDSHQARELYATYKRVLLLADAARP
jgi:hypothetical protein